MSGTLQIVGPGEVELIEGVATTSLDLLPPGGIAVADSNPAASVSVTLQSPAALSASSAGGATISGVSGNLTISGALAAVNDALANLSISGTAPGTTTIAIAASDGTLGTTATLAVQTVPDAPPAFVAPPSSLALTAGIATPLGLTLADGAASALGVLGAAPESLTVTLIASSGDLLLDPSAFPGIAIVGDATDAITLSATSADLAGLNAALSAIALEAPSGGTFEYIARQTGGPLTATVTSGSLTYAASGSIAASTETWSGGAGDWQNPADWSGGAAPGLGSTVTIGNGATLEGDGVAAQISLAANASVVLDAAIGVGSADLAAGGTLAIIGGSFNAGGVTLGPAGALIDFGALVLDGLDAQGTALLPNGAVLGGPVAVQQGGLIDFAGLVQVDSAAATTGLIAISLDAGATIEGAGTLIAGNFSESENIAGPGTILARGPAPLTVSAGSLGGGAHLVIAPGAVLELGAISPLFGVFNPTPISVDGSATISFAPGASDARDRGPYASALGEQGGVLVLDNPGHFSGTIDNFAPGDRIVFGTLTSLSVFDVTGTSFEVSGVNAAGQTEIVTIHASYASGSSPAIETDAAGNPVIGLRATGAALTVNDTPATSAEIDAVGGFATPIEGLGLIVPSNGGAGLVLTIAPVTGLIAESGGAATASLTLTAATALALNADLAALAYTSRGSGSGDTLRFTGGGGLAGFTAAIGVAVTAPATLGFDGASGAGFGADDAWQGGVAPANGDLAVLGTHAGGPDIVTGSGVAGEVSIGGAYDLAGVFDLPGLAGTALDIGSGATALFDANAVVTLGGAAMIGDVTGAGTLGVAGTLVGDITVGGAARAGGSLLDVTGSVSGSSLAIGTEAPATADVAGTLGFAATTLGGAAGSGAILAAGTASLGLGALDIANGTLSLAGSAIATAGSTTLAAGLLAIGPETGLTAGTIAIGVAATLDLAGHLAASVLDASGAATIAGGVASLAGAVSLGSGAMLDFAAGTLAAASLTVASGATLTGSGAIGAAATGVSLIPIDAAGMLEAEGGTLILGGDLAGDAAIAANAVLDLVGGASGGTIGFAGTDAVLTIDDAATMRDSVVNFAAGDAIDLVGIAPSLVSVANGTVSIADPAQFALATGSGQPSPTVSGDGHGGSLITAGGAMPCFTRGTMLLTPDGYRTVESLRPGDKLVTIGGIARRVAWIGWRSLDLATDPSVDALRPVAIAPGAFGPGRPGRVLAVSPLHAIFVQDALIPAILLVNGATITRDAAAFAVTYYHVELDRHDIVLAENLPAETYRDNGNRGRFAESLGVPGAFLPACAELMLGGTPLRAARIALHRRALALGYEIVHGTRLDAAIGADIVVARRRGTRMIFDLPNPTNRIALRTACGVPAETDPASEDRRRLGVCAGAVRADGRIVAAETGAGWHPRAPADRGRWSTERAELLLPRAARRISMEILGSIPCWQASAMPYIMSR